MEYDRDFRKYFYCLVCLYVIFLIASCNSAVDEVTEVTPVCSPDCVVDDACISDTNCSSELICANNFCGIPICGDNIRSGTEECDDGINLGAYGGCNADCTLAAYCGDSVVSSFGELVTDGDFSSMDFSAWTQLVSNSSLEEAIVVPPDILIPPLSGSAYRIRPGGQVTDAGRSQQLSVEIGRLYRWSIDVGMNQLQGAGGIQESFELRIGGDIVWSVTHSDTEYPTTDSATGIYTPTSNVVDLELVFNRTAHSATFHPHWFADNVSFSENIEECDNGVNNGTFCTSNCMLVP